MYELTGFQRDLLYVAAAFDAPHGLTFAEELEKYYESAVEHGRLYPNLDTLVEEGFIEKGKKDKRTNYYSLTPDGRAALEHRRNWVDEYTSDVV